MSNMNIPEYKIVPVRGHYEVIDGFGRIVCSGDTMKEVESDIIDMIKDMIGGEQFESSNSKTACKTATRACESFAS